MTLFPSEDGSASIYPESELACDQLPDPSYVTLTDGSDATCTAKITFKGVGSLCLAVLIWLPSWRRHSGSPRMWNGEPGCPSRAQPPPVPARCPNADGGVWDSTDRLHHQWTTPHDLCGQQGAQVPPTQAMPAFLTHRMWAKWMIVVVFRHWVLELLLTKR